MHLSQLTLISTAIFICAVNTAPISAQDLQDIQAAWNRRKDHVQSARVVWRESHLLPKGAGVTLDFQARNVGDRKFTNRWSLLIDGAKARSEFRRVGNEKIASVVVFEDDILTAYHDKPFSPNEPRPVGSITRHDKFSHPKLPSILPVFWALRMNEEIFRTSLSDRATLELQQGNIGGTECLIVTDRRGRSTYEYWVAPSKEFNVLRRIYRGGRTVSQTDVSYERHEELGWYPVSWMKSFMMGPRLMGEWRAVVDEFQINPELADANFEVSFPPGILLQNGIEGESYITRENGEHRLILPSERGASFEDLKATESGEALMQGKNTFGPSANG